MTDDVLDLPREPAHLQCQYCGAVFTGAEYDITLDDGDDDGEFEFDVLGDDLACPNCGVEL